MVKDMQRPSLGDVHHPRQLHACTQLWFRWTTTCWSLQQGAKGNWLGLGSQNVLAFLGKQIASFQILKDILPIISCKWSSSAAHTHTTSTKVIIISWSVSHLLHLISTSSGRGKVSSAIREKRIKNSLVSSRTTYIKFDYQLNNLIFESIWLELIS